MALTPGDIIDSKYRIVRLLGEGGMGAVFEGENLRIHRRVAIKVLHGGVAENADAVQRFEREAQAAGRIGSEHIVEVLDLGNLESGDRYMVMEYLDGSSLSDRIRERGRLTPHELCPIARQILDGLEAAHGAGIIHRDLKPDNVFLLRTRGGQADFAKLLDFGISKFSALSGESGFSMTRTGSVMGTPYYMSPEQAKGAKGMDHRADLYAVGVIFYECVTGQVPFNADTFNELLFKIVLEQPPPLSDLAPDLDPSFAAIIEKTMAREPAHRYQTAAELKAALEAWMAGSPQVIAPAPAVAVAVAATAPTVPAPAATLGTNTPAQTGPSQTALGTGTPEPWSSSGSYPKASDEPAAAKKSSTGMFLGIAAAAVVVLGGGFAAMKMGGGKAAAAATENAPAAAPDPKPVEAPKPAETAKAAGPTKPEEAPKPAESAKAAEPVGDAARTATRSSKSTPTSKSTSTAKTAEPPPTAPPAATQPAGRKVRKTL